MIGAASLPNVGAEYREVTPANTTAGALTPVAGSFAERTSGPLMLHVKAGTTFEGLSFGYAVSVLRRQVGGTTGSAEPVILNVDGDIRGAGGAGGGGWGGTNLSGGGGGGGAGTPGGAGGISIPPGSSGTAGTATTKGSGGAGSSNTSSSFNGGDPEDGGNAVNLGLLTAATIPETLYIDNKGTIWAGGGGGGGGDTAGDTAGKDGGDPGDNGTASGAARKGDGGLSLFAIDSDLGSRTQKWLSGDASPFLEGALGS